MALLVEYKCEQTIPNIYTIKHKYIKHIKKWTIKTCKIYKHKCVCVREREMSNHKHGRIISRFEHTCSTSPPSTLWRISIIIDLARSLGTSTLTTSSLKNSLTRKSLTCSHKNNTRKHTSLTRPHLYKFSIQMGWNTWWSLHLITTKTLFTEVTTSTTPHNTRMKSCDHFSWSQK